MSSLHSSISTELVLFWGKRSSKEGRAFHHPLICHLIDVAHVCGVLWEQVLHRSLKQTFSKTLGLSEKDTRDCMIFWAACHDIGKASPAFQGKDEALREILEKRGFRFPKEWKARHEVITAKVLPELLEGRGISERLASEIATCLGGHHGLFPSANEVLNLYDADIGAEKWHEARESVINVLASLLGISMPRSKLHAKPGHIFFMLFAGLVSVADWIASNESFFRYVGNDVDIESYPSCAAKRAEEAMEKLGWMCSPRATGLPTLAELFPQIGRSGLWPVQKAVEKLSHIATAPGLVLIEAPMGEGKTEAAMFLADRWGVNLEQQGYYFALPTQATSDQMFNRVKAFLQERFREDVVNLQLLHGHAALSEEFEVLKLRGNELLQLSSVGEEEADGNIIAAEWFTHRKRGLLAPFGVGTIDQILLAVLQTKHVFVRLFGLANKTVIIDEVHAYDAYMNVLLERLLMWLRAIGSSVVLLSATLPKARRHALLKAYAGESAKEIADAHYPRISWVEGDAVHTSSFPAAREISIELRWVNENVSLLGCKIKKILRDGGCAAVICNTVERAQEVYRALKEHFPGRDAIDHEPELDLLHARFLFGEREKREKRALRRFGKPSGMVDGIPVKRPHRAVLVATQVIEQSLDLDFDLMVTELAPIDLVLQRAGRLHRHERTRPKSLSSPQLWILEPALGDDGVPIFGKKGRDEFVYHKHLLLRSWLTLKKLNSKCLRIPSDVEDLIAAVYDDSESPPDLGPKLRQAWDESYTKIKEERENKNLKAQTLAIPNPISGDDTAETRTLPLEEDNPDIHPDLQALTRDTDVPSISVICLYKDQMGNIYIDPLCTQLIHLDDAGEISICKTLLRHSLTLSHAGLAHSLLRDFKPPHSWRNSAYLRHHRVLLFDEKSQLLLQNWRLMLDPELGLVISRHTSEKGR